MFEEQRLLNIFCFMPLGVGIKCVLFDSYTFGLKFKPYILQVVQW